METDIRYYRRRAYEEMSAASRAVTSAARDRRLQLVSLYLERLEALNAPCPFDERQLAELRHVEASSAGAGSPFCWVDKQIGAEVL